MSKRSDGAARGIFRLSIVVGVVIAAFPLSYAAYLWWTKRAEVLYEHDWEPTVSAFLLGGLVTFAVVVLFGQAVIWIVRGFMDDREPKSESD